MEPIDPVDKNDRAPNAESESKIQSDHTRQQLSVATAPPQGQPAEARYTVTSNPKKDWWDKAKPYVEILGVILLAVYTGYTIKMYYANKEAADAAKSAADTAHFTLTNTIEQFRLEERPYLIAHPELTNHNLPVGQKISVTVHFPNVGKTPALNATDFAIFIRFPEWAKKFTSPGLVDALKFIDNAFDKCVRSISSSAAPTNREDVAPADEIFATVPLRRSLNDPSEFHLSQDQVNAIVNGKDALLCLGIARYGDVFDGAFETEFCWFYSGSDFRSWTVCPAHNVIHRGHYKEQTEKPRGQR